VNIPDRAIDVFAVQQRLREVHHLSSYTAMTPSGDQGLYIGENPENVYGPVHTTATVDGEMYALPGMFRNLTTDSMAVLDTETDKVANYIHYYLRQED
jgi:hypothetical protein